MGNIETGYSYSGRIDTYRADFHITGRAQLIDEVLKTITKFGKQYVDSPDYNW
jgi:hypothetical protein